MPRWSGNDVMAAAFAPARELLPPRKRGPAGGIDPRNLGGIRRASALSKARTEAMMEFQYAKELEGKGGPSRRHELG